MNKVLVTAMALVLLSAPSRGADLDKAKKLLKIGDKSVLPDLRDAATKAESPYERQAIGDATKALTAAK